MGSNGKTKVVDGILMSRAMDMKFYDFTPANPEKELKYVFVLHVILISRRIFVNNST
jgi:hypothetical protein